MILADHLMGQFSSNLPPPPRSRSSRGSSITSGGQPQAPSSTIVFAPTAIVTPSSGGAALLAPVPNHGHRVHEDVVPPVESLELAPRMDKGK